jgi:helix-turn-helix protein
VTPEELVRGACPTILARGAAFFSGTITRAKGDEYGLTGTELYVLGRGGVLGDVEPLVVASAFGWFNTETIAALWTSATAKLAPRDGGRMYASACQEYGRTKLGALPAETLGAFCRAASAVNDAADPAGLALYAGWRAEPLPPDPPARAMQLLHVLREFRGSAHLLAVLASGLTPKVAHFLQRPDYFTAFGYTDDDRPAVAPDAAERLHAAEQLTDRLVTPAFAVLDGEAQAGFLDGLRAIDAALARPAG